MTEPNGKYDSNWEKDLVTKLASAALREQRRARLWGIFFKLLTFAYITFILLTVYDWRGSADRIYVSKSSVVGSIGVLMNGFGFTGLMDKLGIDRRLITAGENKGMLDPFSPVQERDVEHAKKLVNDIHQQFIAVVREGRGKRLKETPDMFSGLIWTGQASIELGLADGLGSLDSVPRDVIKAQGTVDFSHKQNIAEKFARRFGVAAANTMVEALLRASPVLR